MFHLVTGGSGSGKSSYAEEQTLCMSGQSEDGKKSLMHGKPCIYIATMKPYGEETLKKIERHQRLRAGKGFVTLERCRELDKLKLPENSGVLLECLSNLAANELYREDGRLSDRQETEERILEGIGNILNQTDHLVVVTNEVSSDIGDYSKETKEYTAFLGELNRRLACMADQVTEVVYGIPVPVKR